MFKNNNNTINDAILSMGHQHSKYVFVCNFTVTNKNNVCYSIHHLTK